MNNAAPHVWTARMMWVFADRATGCPVLNEPIDVVVFLLGAMATKNCLTSY